MKVKVWVAAVLGSGLLVVSGCGGSKSETADSAVSSTTPATDQTRSASVATSGESSSTSDPGTSTSSTPTVPLQGIVAVANIPSRLVSEDEWPTVYTVDPSSGRSQAYAEFSSETDGVAADMGSYYDNGGTPMSLASVFSGDFTKIAVSAVHSDITNAGWMDTDGKVTLVTTSLYEPGQFSDVPAYRDGMFGPGNTYYVSQTFGSGWDAKAKNLVSAPVTDSATVTPAVGSVPGATSSTMWYWVSPNGTVTPMSPGGYLYQENVIKGRGSVRAQGWVSATQWVSVDSQGAQVWLANKLCQPKTCDVMDWGTSGKALTPKVSGFNVWSPVVSPDLKQVAFLANSTAGTGVYVVPISGGQPEQVKVTGDLSLSDKTMLVGWK